MGRGVKPGTSIEARSHPDPFTYSASTLRPVMSAQSALTDVLPPPCRTSEGSPPSSRDP